LEETHRVKLPVAGEALQLAHSPRGPGGGTPGSQASVNATPWAPRL
jgi:hypothetical protein